MPPTSPQHFEAPVRSDGNARHTLTACLQRAARHMVALPAGRPIWRRFRCWTHMRELTQSSAGSKGYRCWADCRLRRHASNASTKSAALRLPGPFARRPKAQTSQDSSKILEHSSRSWERASCLPCLAERAASSPSRPDENAYNPAERRRQPRCHDVKSCASGAPAHLHMTQDRTDISHRRVNATCSYKQQRAWYQIVLLTFLGTRKRQESLPVAWVRNAAEPNPEFGPGVDMATGSSTPQHIASPDQSAIWATKPVNGRNPCF